MENEGTITSDDDIPFFLEMIDLIFHGVSEEENSYDVIAGKLILHVDVMMIISKEKSVFT